MSGKEWLVQHGGVLMIEPGRIFSPYLFIRSLLIFYDKIDDPHHIRILSTLFLVAHRDTLALKFCKVLYSFLKNPVEILLLQQLAAQIVINNLYHRTFIAIYLNAFVIFLIDLERKLIHEILFYLYRE